MEIARNYTPLTPPDQKVDEGGHMLHFLIKIYPDGTVTPQLSTLKPGQVLKQKPCILACTCKIKIS